MSQGKGIDKLILSSICWIGVCELEKRICATGISLEECRKSWLFKPYKHRIGPTSTPRKKRKALQLSA
jgi:hypothetical protein